MLTAVFAGGVTDAVPKFWRPLLRARELLVANSETAELLVGINQFLGDT